MKTIISPPHTIWTKDGREVQTKIITLMGVGSKKETTRVIEDLYPNPEYVRPPRYMGALDMGFAEVVDE